MIVPDAANKTETKEERPNMLMSKQTLSGPARRAFFNAEVMTRDVNEREASTELAELSKIRFVIEQKWHTRFEAARVGGVHESRR